MIDILCAVVLLMVFAGALGEYRRQKRLQVYRMNHPRRPR